MSAPNLFFSTLVLLMLAMSGCISKYPSAKAPPDVTMPSAVPPRAETLGQWQQFPSPGARHSFGLVAASNFLYILGGHSGGVNTDTAFFTRINPDGSLGAWQATTPLPEQSALNAAAHQNRIYVLSGESAKVYCGTVNADGSIARWDLTSSLPPRRVGMPAVYKNTLYSIGGWYHREVFAASIKDDGLLAEWRPVRHLISPRHSGYAFAHGDYLYFVGGNAGHLADTRKENVYRTKAQADGNLEKWAAATPLPVANDSFAGVLAKDRIFIFGGGGLQDKIISATIDKDGEIGEWGEEKLTLPKVLVLHRGVYVNGWIYIAGGFTPISADRGDMNGVLYGVPVK